MGMRIGAGYVTVYHPFLPVRIPDILSNAFEPDAYLDPSDSQSEGRETVPNFEWVLRGSKVAPCGSESGSITTTADVARMSYWGLRTRWGG